jgi:hypothetical protein
MFDQNHLYPYGSPEQTTPEMKGQNCIILDLASGQMVIIGDFNYFRIDDADRALVQAIAAAVKEHRAAKPETPPVPTGLGGLLDYPSFVSANVQSISQEPTPEVKKEDV